MYICVYIFVSTLTETPNPHTELFKCNGYTWLLDTTGTHVERVGAECSLANDTSCYSCDVIDLSGHGIRSFGPNALSGVFADSVDINNNDIVALSPGLFANSRLRAINISDNQIASLPPDMFVDVAALQQLDLVSRWLVVLDWIW